MSCSGYFRHVQLLGFPMLCLLIPFMIRRDHVSLVQLFDLLMLCLLIFFVFRSAV